MTLVLVAVLSAVIFGGDGHRARRAAAEQGATCAATKLARSRVTLAHDG